MVKPHWVGGAPHPKAALDMRIIKTTATYYTKSSLQIKQWA